METCFVCGVENEDGLKNESYIWGTLDKVHEEVIFFKNGYEWVLMFLHQMVGYIMVQSLSRIIGNVLCMTNNLLQASMSTQITIPAFGFQDASP